MRSLSVGSGVNVGNLTTPMKWRMPHRGHESSVPPYAAMLSVAQVSDISVHVTVPYLHGLTVAIVSARLELAGGNPMPQCALRYPVLLGDEPVECAYSCGGDLLAFHVTDEEQL